MMRTRAMPGTQSFRIDHLNLISIAASVNQIVGSCTALFNAAVVQTCTLAQQVFPRVLALNFQFVVAIIYARRQSDSLALQFQFVSMPVQLCPELHLSSCKTGALLRREIELREFRRANRPVIR